MSRERKEQLFKIIKEANEELEEIRSTCKHEHFHEANYSHDSSMRRIVVGDICDDCGKFLRETKPFEYPKVKTFDTNTGYSEDIALPKGSLLDSIRKTKKDLGKNEN